MNDFNWFKKNFFFKTSTLTLEGLSNIVAYGRNVNFVTKDSLVLIRERTDRMSLWLTWVCDAFPGFSLVMRGWVQGSSCPLFLPLDLYSNWVLYCALWVGTRRLQDTGRNLNWWSIEGNLCSEDVKLLLDGFVGWWWWKPIIDGDGTGLTCHIRIKSVLASVFIFVFILILWTML